MAAVFHFEHLLPPSWKTVVANWITEDTPSFDVGGYVVGESEQEAILYGKASVCHCLSHPCLLFHVLRNGI